jgi:hypothetical protein
MRHVAAGEFAWIDGWWMVLAVLLAWAVSCLSGLDSRFAAINDEC